MTDASKPIVPIEDLMDSSIDDLADMPAFEVPPKGHYKLSVSLERKTINDKPTVEAKCVVLETLELANQNDKPMENGGKFSQLFMMDNEFGQGSFKLFIQPIAAGLNLGGQKMGAVVAAVQNVQIACTVKHRPDKTDKDRIYALLVNPELV